MKNDDERKPLLLSPGRGAPASAGPHAHAQNSPTRYQEFGSGPSEKSSGSSGSGGAGKTPRTSTAMAGQPPRAVGPPRVGSKDGLDRDHFEPTLSWYSPYDLYEGLDPKVGHNEAQWVAVREKQRKKFKRLRLLGTMALLLGCALLVALLWEVGFREIGFVGTTPDTTKGAHSATAKSVAEAAASSPITILFFLVDDLGTNDIAYNEGTDLPLASPAMAKAALSGVILTSYYTYSECTPSRSSLLTGMYPSSIGMQHDCITTCDPFGVPVSTGLSLLPQVLKEHHNYVCAMVGKWDVGHYAKQSWPTSRGFDTSLHLNCFGYTDYSRHTNLGGWSDLHDGFESVVLVTKTGEVEGEVGGWVDGFEVDSADSRYSTFVFTKRAVDAALAKVMEGGDASGGGDAYLEESDAGRGDNGEDGEDDQSSINDSGGSSDSSSSSSSSSSGSGGSNKKDKNNNNGGGGGSGGPSSSSSSPSSLESLSNSVQRPYDNFLKKHSTKRRRKILAETDDEDETDFPGLFVYVAWNAVHSTLSVPRGFNKSQEYAAITAEVDLEHNPTRALLAGALKQVDDGFDSIMEALRFEGLYERSVVVVCSDNGGSLDDGGNNLPFRGGKRTLFEGGIRVPAFLHSPLLPSTVRGTTYDGIVHVSDWLPTLAYGAQGTAIKAKDASKYDGVDQWAYLTAGSSSSSVGEAVGGRTEFDCGIDYLTGDAESGDVVSAAHIANVTGCVVKVVSDGHQLHRYKFIWNEGDFGWVQPNQDSLLSANGTLSQPRAGAYLFDLTTDPTETINLLWNLPALSSATAAAAAAAASTAFSRDMHERQDYFSLEGADANVDADSSATKDERTRIRPGVAAGEVAAPPIGERTEGWTSFEQRGELDSGINKAANGGITGNAIGKTSAEALLEITATASSGGRSGSSGGGASSIFSWRKPATKETHSSESQVAATAKTLIDSFCDIYQNMAPAQWKKKLGYPKKVFRDNDNFVTYWATKVNEVSMFASEDDKNVIDGPECTGFAILSLIHAQTEPTERTESDDARSG